MTTEPTMTEVIAKVIEENLLDDSPDYWPSFKAWAQEAADELVKAGFGDVTAAKAGALREAADALERSPDVRDASKYTEAGGHVIRLLRDRADKIEEQINE